MAKKTFELDNSPQKYHLYFDSYFRTPLIMSQMCQWAGIFLKSLL